MSDWIQPRRITEDDLTWKFGKTTADEINHVESQLCNHARGFVLNNEIWFDQYAVMMGHRFAWNSHISQYYPGAEKWVDVCDNALYFSLTGSGNFVLQFPIGNNLTKKHLETLYALGKKMGFDDSYDIILRNEEYEPYENSSDTTTVTLGEIYNHLTEGAHSVKFAEIYDKADEKNGTPYRTRMERKNNPSDTTESNSDETSDNENEEESTSSQDNGRTVAVTNTHIEPTDDGVYDLYFTAGRENEEFWENVKWGEIVTRRQAKRFADELLGTHFSVSEVKRLQNSKYITGKE